MNPDTLWLVRLGIDQGLFTRAQAVSVKARLGGRLGMLEFAQKLVDEDIVTDLEGLETIAGHSALKAKKGPPPQDPFLSAEDLVEEVIPMPIRKAPAGPPPSIAVENLSSKDDKEMGDTLKGLLASSVKFGASDLHLCTGRRPFVRKDREISYISEKPLSSDEALKLNTALLSPEQKKTFLADRDLDYALAVSASERYRVNLMYHKEGPAGCYRMVPKETRTMQDLGFASHLDTLKKFLSYHNGLVLITGPVGAGKTTTLASMVAYLNETRKDHIITVEDPIEVVQVSKGCNVTQRQVGDHTKTFFTALKGALREDPDIIVIGELRDLETIEMAVSAAETGHLVIGTMHTSDAATTLNRLLDVFPAAQQTQIRASVAESLRGIVCQRLLPATNGGLVMACEIMVNTVAIANLVREGKTTGLRNSMETGVREGMCLMDNVILALYQDKKVSKETALSNITNRTLRARIT
ncbi:MAG TPA: PilT/PilU family type 4a pilus ATPase [Opitutaceae bacterium]|jgi:twitching motility protein PilT|nr:PilT/PilU family type 4a pilus ATPase [Opitutaceae bacterium]